MSTTDSTLPRSGPPPRPGTRPAPGRNCGSGLFRAFWRWHFYASFLVAPVLVVLATTGLIYLFRFQIEPLLHADLMRVEAKAGALQQPYAAQLKAVEKAHPTAMVRSMTEPAELGHTTRFSIVTTSNENVDVFVDPGSAKVLGDLNPNNTVSGYAVRLHGNLMAGELGDIVVELAACWALVMALTGYFLFVKGWRARRRAAKRRTPGSRLRAQHAYVGAFVGAGLLLLLVSGLPWTGFWGAKVQDLASSQGSSMWSKDHGAISDPTSRLDESLPHSHKTEVPWGQGASEVPRSTKEGLSVANLDTAMTVAHSQGLRRPMTVALPSGEEDVFSVIGYAFDAPTDERTVHIDQYGANVISTYGFDDYPKLAKVVSLGIGLHEGRSLGLWSFWGAAAMCLAVIFACVSGPLMWWRRRPRGKTVGAPRGRMPIRTTPLLAIFIVALGVFLPFFGISLLMILAIDHLLLRRAPALRDFFETTPT